MKMKTIIAAVALAAGSLVAVTANAAAAASTPEQAVKTYFSAMESGDQNTFFSVMKLPDAAAKMPADILKQTKDEMFKEMSAKLKEEGGIKSLDIAKAKVNPDGKHAIVHVKAVTGKGSASEEDLPAIKSGNAWQLGE